MLLNNSIEFLDKIFEKLDESGIDVSKYELDHIAYQAKSDEDYDNLKPEMQKIAELIDEKVVGNRRVGIFKLVKPIVYKDYSISAMELVAPKKNQVCPSALEHTEFVIDEDFTDFMARYPGLDWDTSMVEHPDFPMTKIQLDNHMQVKFHYYPVLEIVNK